MFYGLCIHFPAINSMSEGVGEDLRLMRSSQNLGMGMERRLDDTVYLY